MNLSIIIPLLNEAESLTELHQWILDELTPTSLSFEILFIDDGSTDNSWEVIEKLHQSHSNTHGLRFSKNFGKSQALHAGFAEAKGSVVVTLDADLQDAPSEIPNLYHRIQKENLDLISGWKKKRYDSLFLKNIPSKLFNWAARRSSGIYLHDFNCGIKAYKSEVIKTIEVFGEMHRYIPVLAAHAGFTKIGEQIVQHQARKYGVTKFGWTRFVNGFLDLLTLRFLNKFGKRPMHFFGLIGTVMLLVGFFFSIYLGFDKLFIKTSGRLITERPEFFIALATMIMGSQFFLAGFLGEIILRNKKIKKQYKIAEKLVNE